MFKLIHCKIALIALVLLMSAGCDSLFDKGHTERAYDGPTVVGFFPLQREVTDAAGSTWVQVQLIGPQRNSDLQVQFAVDGTSTAVAGQHYTIASSPVTLAAGTSTVNININLIEGSVTGEVRLILNLTGTSDANVEPSANLTRSTLFIRGS